MREAYIKISSILKTDFHIEVERVQNTLIILAVCFCIFYNIRCNNIKN